MMTPTPVTPPQYAPLQRQMRHLSPPNHDGHHSTSHPRCRWTWPLFLMRSLPLAITRTAMALLGSLVALLVPLMAHLGWWYAWYRRWHSWDRRRCGTACFTSHCGTDFGAAISVVMHLLTSGLGTNDDPQPPATPLAVSPTTRPADGLNFDLLNRSRLALHACWQKKRWTHWRWKIGFRISPRYITFQRIAPACRRDRHCACVAPTTLAGRPPQSFRWIKANWARRHCDTPTIDGLGRSTAHTLTA